MFSKKKERMYRRCTEGTRLKQWNARGKGCVISRGRATKMWLVDCERQTVQMWHYKDFFCTNNIRSCMTHLCRKMRCSKVKIIGVLLIFSIVAGVHLLLSHSEVHDRKGSHLARLWRSSETKPHAQGETWISGKLL